MVIKQVGEATGNVISSTGEAFNKATSGIPWPVKAGIIVGGVGAAGYLTYYLIQQLTGTQGGSCMTPGTPCYTAINPYAQTYQTCANEYAQNLSNYLAEDNKNGTGFTTAQLSNLNYLANCMNTAASNIASEAKKYAPQNPLLVLVYFLGAGAAIAISLVGGAEAVKILRSTKSFAAGFNNGFQVQQAMNDAAIRAKIASGDISPDEASGIDDQYSSMTQENINYSSQQIQQYAADDIITQEEADAVDSEVSTAMEDDAAETEDELEGLFE
ncbi:MAG: hypothetical protein QW393_03455 [Candidatus Micrarchaeaceae archaeon]